MSKKSNPAPKPAARPVTLAELTALCQQWFTLHVSLPDPLTGAPGERLALRVRRLMPAEDARVQLLLSEALPELKPKPGPDGKPVPGAAEMDLEALTSPAFLERSARQNRLARALVVYLACEQFHTDPHGATLRDGPPAALAEWVERQAHEHIIDDLYRVASSAPVTAAQAESFTSATAFPNR